MKKTNLFHLDIPSTTPPLPPAKTFPRLPLAVTIPIIALMFFATFTFAFNLGKQNNQAVIPTPTPVPPTALATPTEYIPAPTPTIISLNLSTLIPEAVSWLQFPATASLDVYQKPDNQGYASNSNIIYKDIKYLHVGNHL